MKKSSYVPQKGDLVWLNFSPQSGREQRGRRPALVVSSDIYNRTGLMLACPITSKIKGYPFEVIIQSGSTQGSVLADHVKNQDWKTRHAEYIAKAPSAVLNRTQQIIAALLLN
jgi:mRNA interferase MazF